MARGKVKVDPITVATTWHFLQRVCREMRDTVERTATNVLITTLHDMAYGIWDAQGQAIAIPEGFPCRLISSSFPIRAVIKQFHGQIYPGDVYLTNHPFKAGAVHLPDWVFIRPIFYKNELVFFNCMGAHMPDSGGARPGAFFLAFDAVAEGLNIPPIKLVEKGRMREDILNFILSNNRLPDMMRREIRALIGSTGIAERRLIELLDKYGKESVLASIEEMMNRTEKAVRAEIARWPEGTYYAEAKTDDDGAELGKPVTVRCKLTILDGELTFDFSDSDPQADKGNINAYYSMTMSDTMSTCFLFFDPALSSYHNEGSLKPIHVIAREGTVVNAKPGSRTALSPSITGTMVIECALSVLSQALPQHAIAPYGKAVHLMFIGKDPRTDEMYVYISFCPGGGAGAVTNYDGYQCCTDMGALGVVAKADAEEEMVRFPWRVTKYEFLTDSAGAGKWRGALGIWWEGINGSGDCTSTMGPCDGWYTQGQGQQGGHPTPLNRCHIIRGNERIDITQPHLLQDIKAGDTFVCKSGGGAGIGLPEERDPEAVRIDVKNELVSIGAARDIYKVVLKPDTLEIDYGATQELRTKR